MKTAFLLVAASAATATFAIPAAAQAPYYPQQPYGQPVPQPYPGQPGYGYGQQGYQGYGNQGANPLGQVIDQLLGNRYAVNDRTAVTQCASAVMAQAQMQQRGGGYGYGQSYNYGSRQGGYGQAYGQPYGAPGYGQAYGNGMRVTAITEVQRRKNGLRVRGLIDSGMNRYGGGGYGGGYGQPGYGNGNANAYSMADLKFRCTVDYRGAVTDIRIDRNDDNRRR